MMQVTPPTTSWASARSGRGFTIIELLIAVVILGVLLAIALPNYQSSVRKSRRTEAFNALNSITQAQERHRSNNATFTANLTASPSASIPGLGQPNTRTGNGTGFYNLTVNVVDTTTYEALAEAIIGTSQAADGACAVLGVRMEGGNARYGAGASTAAVNWSDPQRCWAR